MPKQWTDKDERMYEHIKESQEEQGAKGRAEEIAARTVNKKRQKEGRTENKTSQGTGKPDEPLQEKTVQELRNLASDKDIGGRSKMTKSELINALQKAG